MKPGEGDGTQKVTGSEESALVVGSRWTSQRLMIKAACG